MRVHSGWLLANMQRGFNRVLVLCLGLAIILGLAAAVMFVRSELSSSGSSALGQEEQRLLQAIQQDPNNPDLRVSLADVYLQEHRYDEAIAQYNEALKANDKNEDALIGLGMAYREKGDRDQALSMFDKVIEVTKDSEFASVDRRLESVYYYLGQIHLERNEPADAVDALQAALKIEPTDADALYLLGNALQAQGEHDGAIAVYGLATSLVPDFRDAYEGMAAAADKKGDTLTATYARAMIRLYSGDAKGAVSDLENVVEKLPENASAYFGLGYGYEQLGEHDKAVAAYQQSTQIDPTQYAARSALTRLGSQ